MEENEEIKINCKNCIYQGFGETCFEPICTHPCGPIGILDLEEEFKYCVGYEKIMLDKLK